MKQNKWRSFLSHRRCLMCAGSFEGKGGRQSRSKKTRAVLGVSGPLSSYQRRLFRGANPVASVDHTHNKVHTHIALSVLSMIRGKLTSTDSCLYFMTGSF